MPLAPVCALARRTRFSFPASQYVGPRAPAALVHVAWRCAAPAACAARNLGTPRVRGRTLHAASGLPARPVPSCWRHAGCRAFSTALLADLQPLRPAGRAAHVLLALTWGWLLPECAHWVLLIQGCAAAPGPL